MRKGRHKKLFSKKLRIRGLIALTVAASLVFVWVGRASVFANIEVKTVHVFPTMADVRGWEAKDNALYQNLAADANVADFNEDNAAYLVLDASPAPPPSGGGSSPVEVEVPSEPDETASSTEEATEEGTPPASPPANHDEGEDEATDSASTTVETPAPEPEVTPAPEPDPEPAPQPAEEEASTTTEANTPPPDDSPTTPETEPTTAEPEPAPEPTPVPAPEETPAEEDAPPASDESGDVSALGRMIDFAAAAFEKVLSVVTDVAVATTSNSIENASSSDEEIVSMPPDVPSDDVARCALLGHTCHTVTLGGFDLGGGIDSKIFKRASIAFSFAGVSEPEDLIEDSLLVRYYRDGAWREAGEVHLAGVVSNATNGGYFTYPLPDVEAWEDLEDIIVMIEYDRATSGRAELYLDGAWIDASYKERVQDVLSGDAEKPIPGLPQNVTDELRDGGGGDPIEILTLPGGERIVFAYADDLSNPLQIKTDKPSYSGIGGNTVFAAITNTLDTTEHFRLVAASPEDGQVPVEIFAWKSGVPQTVATPVVSDVTYFCEESWEAATSSDAGGEAYGCAETGEEQSCSSLNDDATNCVVSGVEVDTLEEVVFGNDWVALGASDPSAPLAKRMRKWVPGEYSATLATDEQLSVLSGQTLYFKITFMAEDLPLSRFAIAALGEGSEGVIVSDALDRAAIKKLAVTDKETNAVLGAQKYFRKDDLPSFQFKFKSQRNALVRMFKRLRGQQASFTVEDVVLVHKSGERFRVPVDIVYEEGDEWRLDIKDRPSPLTPGEYTLNMVLEEDGYRYTDSYDFTWGVLAINTTRSMYETGETAAIEMAALSPTGNTVCDARLVLRITDPTGEEARVPVSPSGACQGNNVVDVPDYASRYQAGIVGVYGMRLSRLDVAGETIAEITDSFEVRDAADIPIIVERTGPTRIFPLANYEMSIDVTARESFAGRVTESVPVGFTIIGGNATDEGGRLSWQVDLAAGESTTLRYTFDALDKSPYLYTVGPLTFDNGSGGDPEFQELREWQIASDATGNLILFWDDAGSLPFGWSCVSCTGGDDFFGRLAVGSSTYGTAGGATTHNHSATGSVLGSSAVTTEEQSGSNIADVAHTHSYSPTIGDADNFPLYRELRVIQSDNAGDSITIPAGAIALFDVASSSLPTNWYRYAEQDGYYAAGTTTVGNIGGSNTHSHTISGSTGAAGGGTQQARGGNPAATGASAGHTHTIDSTTGTVSNEPPHVDVLFARVTASQAPDDSMIGMWSDEPPSNWQSLSGSGGDFENKYFKAATTYNASAGGTVEHTHADVTGITSSVPVQTQSARGPGEAGSSNTHTHSVSVVDFSTDQHLPPHVGVIVAKRLPSVALYTQSKYRWYANDSSSTTPSDPWPSGGTDASEDEAIDSALSPVKPNVPVRLRLALDVSFSTSSPDEDSFILQFAPGDTCSAATEWADVGTAASTTALWRGYDNGSLADNDTLSTPLLLTGSDVAGTYEENGTSATTPLEIGVGESGEWDYVIRDNNAAAGTNYCFRLLNDDRSLLEAYTVYPQLLTDYAPNAPTLSTPFDNEQLASTSPWFTFVTTDPESADLHYQIQVDDDIDFGSAEIDADSISNEDDFLNTAVPADKAPFTSGQAMQYTSVDTLSNNTTYWWRVRAEDPNGSGEWGEWSSAQSFTVDTSTSITTWFQTTIDQFETDTHSGTDATTTDQITLLIGSTTGTVYSPLIDYDWKTTGTAWGELAWNDTEPGGSTILYSVEYWDGDSWELVPDGDLSGNSSGFGTSPISLLGLDTDTYNQIRIAGDLTDAGTTPGIQDWTVEWGFRVETPTLSKLFDNEKTGTTTPIFEFTTSDPQSDDLTYQISWSTDNTFTSSTTHTSSEALDGFADLDAPLSTDPFPSGDTIQYTIQSADALTDNTTYWWRVRAKDTTGGNAWSLWSDARSFTTDTSVTVSTWFQTTAEQFETDTLSGMTTQGDNTVTVATTTDQAIFVYGEGTESEPRYRLWDGSSWGAEAQALDVGAPINWIVTKAGPTRDEYVMGAIGTDADLNIQVYADGAWGDLLEMTASLTDTNARGFDIAYETDSGDALVVYCDGDADPSYRVWDGSSWSSENPGGAINLGTTINCAWIKLASDPTSDEIILLTTDTSSSVYEALVWDGAAWDDSTTQGSNNESNEGMAVEYEASGGQAVIVTADGNPSRFKWNAWSGTGWNPTASNQTTTGHPERAFLTRDAATDAMTLCFTNNGTDVEVIRWTGSAWTGATVLEGTAISKVDRAVDCVYETTAGRTSYVIAPYSDATNARYQYWNGSTWSGEASVSTITTSATVQTRRAGDGNILAIFFDHVNGQLDFSAWSGAGWSSPQTLEDTPSVGSSPFKEPFMLEPQKPQVSGTFISSAVDFDDGSGPLWDEVSWNDSEPGSSTMLVQVQYYSTTTETWTLVPDGQIAENSTGTSTSPIDINGLDTTTYNQLRLVGTFTCDGPTSCPSLSDWTVTWSEGITVYGSAKEYDRSTPTTSGTVSVAVNGSLQVGKQGTIDGSGNWFISNVTAFADDPVTVYIEGSDDVEGAAVTVYDGSGDITGMDLYARHLAIGSDDNATVSNVIIGHYDNSVAGDENVFFNSDAGNDLTVCATGDCYDAGIVVKAGNTFRPDSTSGGSVAANDIVIDGTLTADGNTITATGSWLNSSVFNANTSTVVLAATTTSELVDSTGASTASFNTLTFGTSGAADWTLVTALDVNGALSINFGTVNSTGVAITAAGAVAIGGSGAFEKGTSFTFDGSGSSAWSDATSPKQDLGTVVIDGTSKTVTLGSDVRATNLTIGGNDVFDVTATSFDIEILGNWTNNNSFVPRSGTVTFTATSSGKTVTTGASSFYDLTFNGGDGAWSFPSGAFTVNHDLTIATGTVTFPNATTTIAGSFNATGGAFLHNNGTLNFTSSASGRTVAADGNSLYDLVFSGAGAWTMSDINATTSRDVRITNGTVGLPPGVFAVGRHYDSSGGAFTGSAGTLRLFSTATGNVLYNNSSSFSNLIFDGIGGEWTMSALATSTHDVTFVNGTTTLPTNTFALGGSFTNAAPDAAGFIAGTGIARFAATTSGNTIDPGNDAFATTTFDGTGDWTIIGSATSTGPLTLIAAGSFSVNSGLSIEADSTFTNAVGGAATAWSDSTLYLNSGTTSSINTKTDTGDTYGTLLIGANSDIKMWNSDAGVTTVDASGSLYSQDHAGADGDLYIWGDYATEEEYWSAATDFDGASLAGSERQVDVRFANNAAFTMSTGTLAIVGTSTATTTIAVQTAGEFAMTTSDITLNATYYSFRNLDSNGFGILGSSTVTTLANGDFEMAVTSGGTMLRVSSTTIDANPEMQIQAVRFATSTGVTDGYNVTEVGIPTSYWWFRNHYGNYDGEAYNNDPGGDPGYIRWDDSSLAITVSGNVYSDHGVTPIGASVCDGSDVVMLVLDGVDTYPTSCDGVSGYYEIPGVTFSGDNVMTLFLDTDGGARAATVSRTPVDDIDDFDLYQNIVIVRHEDTASLTNTEMATYDHGIDDDIPFVVSGGDLTVEPDNELLVWPGKTFAPGGNVTLESGGSGSAKDGTLHVGDGATFEAAGSESHSIGGSFEVDTSAAITPVSATFTLTATTTGKTASTTPALTLYNLSFNGSGGAWDLIGTWTVQNTFTVNAGTLQGGGSLTSQSGAIAGSGTVFMSGGTITLDGEGSFGNGNEWQFYDLTTTGTSTRTASATTTILGTLTVPATRVFEAGSAPLVFAGGGTPLDLTGSFDEGTASVYYQSPSATAVADADYYHLILGATTTGSPTYTLLGGTVTVTTDLEIGDGANTTSVTVDSNDPSLTVAGDVLIRPSATLIASNISTFNVGGSWDNDGTFTSSDGTVTFDSADTGETVAAGASSFGSVDFNAASGGWTVTEHATSTGDWSLSNATAFTLSSGISAEVGGTFANAVGGAATTWTGSTLYLNSGTAYDINDSSDTGDIYGSLILGADTDVAMWYSSSTEATVDSSGSLYSQDHAANDGDLYIWGDYQRTAGSDYWSYATDFDGTDLSGGSERQAEVFIATSSSYTLAGGLLDIIGDASASTTIQNQGEGRYAVNVSSGTFNASYYQFRNLDPTGLNLTGAPTISSLSNGDFELEIDDGSLITVAGTVLNANPLKIFSAMRFGTTTGIASGVNVTATGVSVSSWRFLNHYGEIDGEDFDLDPQGDPGYLRWDNSSGAITIAGFVFSDEGTTVSSVCDDSTPVVRLMVEGVSADFVACDSSTGLFQITDVTYNPGEVFTAYLDTNGVARAANVTVDVVTTIADLNLYENRLIVRHEDTSPISIADLAVYDSSDDPEDLFFTAVDSGTDTLTLEPDTKLIVWAGKTFAPVGNVILQSGGSGNAWDGSLDVQNGATFSAAGTQTHSIGGNFSLGGTGTFSSANSSVTFTATTSGKTILASSSPFYDITFNGTNGEWAFQGGAASSTNDFTITAGSVTMPFGTTTVDGSFQNAGTVLHNNGTIELRSASAGETVTFGGSDLYNVVFTGAGDWTISDTNATTSHSTLIEAGTVTLPSGQLAVGASFDNSAGTFDANGGTIRLYASSASQTLRAGGSDFASLLVDGAGADWTMSDTNATSTGDVTILAGTVVFPSGSHVIGGSLVNADTFTHNSGAVVFNSTDTGETVDPGASAFYDVDFDSATGGWTVVASATSTNDWSLSSGDTFIVSTGVSVEVGGQFTNEIGGASTAWTGATLYLNSGASNAINSKSAGGDGYGTLLVGASTDISMWNSSSTATTVDSSGSLYSQDHDLTDGDLYLWGDYPASGSEYWSYATDFDGTSLGGGSERQVNVYIATTSTYSRSSGTLAIVGASGFETTIQNQGVGAFTMTLSGGTLNASYYQFNDLDPNGLTLSSGVTVSSLSNGDYQISSASGTAITVDSTTIDANASLTISDTNFATTSGVTGGANVLLSGTTGNSWIFTDHTGSFDGEDYDQDGADACGSIRWDDSQCFLVSQSHFRFRDDNAGEGVPSEEWYDGSWSKRKRITIDNSTASAVTDRAVKIEVKYDGDMRSDFGDLRFTDDSGTTSIPYWTEDVISSGTSTVWVQVPSLPANDEAVIYVYYGNAAATDVGDGSATFDFFDDFEDGDISEYSGSDASLFEVSTDFNYEGTYGLDASSGNETERTTAGGIRQTGSLLAQGQTIRFLQYVDTTVSLGADDEPCVLFAVQGDEQNYAACLNVRTGLAALSENVESRYNAGASPTVHDTDTVTYTDGWYEVEIDWLTDNSITVTVIDPTGATVATLTTSDSSYTSGGMGFSFWGMHGGWDAYTARAYLPTEPTYSFGLEQIDSGASWLAAEDAVLSNRGSGDDTRIRFSIQNTGSQITGQTFRLQYAAKGAASNCESVTDVSYNDVPVAAGCGSSPVCMIASSNITNHEATNALLSYPAALTFTAGELLEDPSNETGSMTLEQDEFTEVEYAFEMTANATASNYCLRTTDGGVELDDYPHVAEITVIQIPQIDDWQLHFSTDISLTESVGTAISATSTVSDGNGYDDLVSATSTFYRSGVGQNCTDDDNNCYQISSSQCVFSNCSGNSCLLTCTASLQYVADPTDTGATYELENWLSAVRVLDQGGSEANAISSGVEVETLYALAVSPDIDYGSLSVGEDTGVVNQISTVENTGNTSIDVELSGTDLVGGVSSIAVDQQIYATSTFTYSACAICSALSGSDTVFDVDLPKPTATTTSVTDDIYWGINVPVGTGAVSHEGTNTFMAVSGS